MGHNPWETFGDGRQLIVTILGLSGCDVLLSRKLLICFCKLTFLWREQNCQNINELGLVVGWRWSRDHVDVITSWAYDRNAFRAMARPILKYQGHHKFIYNKVGDVFCWTIPSTLTLEINQTPYYRKRKCGVGYYYGLGFSWKWAGQWSRGRQIGWAYRESDGRSRSIHLAVGTRLRTQMGLSNLKTILEDPQVDVM